MKNITSCDASSSSYFLDRFKECNYKVFYKHDFRPYNINIVGWRNSSIDFNKFNDFIAIYFEVSNGWFSKLWPASTLPGCDYFVNPINKNGTAILVPGQYLSSYELGIYKGYEALKQVKPVKVYRDENKDVTIDLNSDKIEEGLFGIHIHKAGFFSKIVGISSGGCQVFQKSKDFEEFIYFCNKAADFWGNRFSYTLMEF